MVAIRGLAEHTAAFVRDRLSKIYSMELIQIIFQRPYCRITDLVDAGIAQRQAASRYLKALAQLGVLAEHKSGRGPSCTGGTGRSRRGTALPCDLGSGTRRTPRSRRLPV